MLGGASFFLPCYAGIITHYNFFACRANQRGVTVAN